MELNRLLERQIKRHLKTTNLESNPELVDLFHAISQAYQHHEENRQLVERALEISSNELSHSNLELRKASQIIELKNQDLVSSLEYAKLVQDSMLSREETLKEIFPKSFIFNKPKEIVSGDFFWVLSQGNDTFLATVDCTGHGVPGAFMSVISFRFLNQAVRDFGLENPSEILNFLNTEIKNTISDKIENEEAKNALDISMVKINNKNKSFEFAGVGQKMIYAKGEELVEIKGDKFHIGQNLDPQKHKITTIEFEIVKDATLYMYSDGFQDQFGGPESKKFGAKRLKEMIGSISGLDLGKQKTSVEDTFQSWKNGYDQVDDTLFMGVQLN
jgi:serine phosphatase RsbU (regulator of sigma subunit)